MSALLRGLPVPEHADDFFDRLRSQIAAEDDDAPFTASTVIDLSVRRSAQPASGRRFQRLMRSATAAAAAVACFVLVVAGGLLARRGDGSRELDDPAVVSEAIARDPTAPQVRRYVTPRAHIPAKTGVRIKYRTSNSGSFEAIISPLGDYRVVRADPGLELRYSSATGTRQMYEVKDDVSRVVTQTDLPAGPPEELELSNPIRTLSRDLGAAVRAIEADSGSEVRKTTWKNADGTVRDALELETEGNYVIFQRQRLVVDVKTGFPVLHEQWNSDGTLERRVQVEELSEDQPFDEGVATPNLSGQTPVITQSFGFRATTTGGAASATGYDPLIPMWLPEGYALQKVAVADAVAPLEGQTNPAYTDIVALVYRNGFDSFTVTTRRGEASLGKPASWSDPFLQGNPLPNHTTPDRVDSGALAGVPLQVGIYPAVWPHVWAQHGDLVVTVAGDLNREQLLKITESLRAVPQ